MAVTGTSGYVGSRIAARLRAEGWRVTRLSHSAPPGADVAPFRLGENVDPRALEGFDALVHCAYDFRPVSRDDVNAINVAGSERLLRAASRAGIEHVVFISSISAFPGCRSVYGHAKLAAEDAARSAGAWIIRPGLVWGESPGGLFGRLVRTVGSAPVLPYPAGGRLVQYLVHDADLGSAVVRCLMSRSGMDGGPVTVANARAWPIRDLLAEIGRAQNRRPLLVPMPWQAAWLPLRIGDGLRLPLRFHSDNLISFVHQNQNPVFDAFDRLGVECREFGPGRSQPV